MGLFARADTAVVAFHQDLVDALQRQPLWFARVCLAVLVACTATRIAMVDLSAFQLVVNLALLTLLWLNCRSAATLASAGTFTLFRYTFLVTFPLDVLVSLLVPSLERLPILLFSVFLTAFFFFAACRPPKPPLPRGRFAMGGA